MCLEDLKIGKATQSGVKKIVLTASSQQIVDPASERTVLIFSPPSSGTMWINFEEQAVLGQGISLKAGDRPLLLNTKDHGDIVQRRWFGIGEEGYGPITEEWLEHADATNGVATATKAAVAGSTHHVTGLSGGYESLAVQGDLGLLDDVTEIQDYAVQTTFAPPLLKPIHITEGNLVSLTLPAGGVGVVGHVNLQGYTTLGGFDFGTVNIYDGQFSMQGMN